MSRLFFSLLILNFIITFHLHVSSISCFNLRKSIIKIVRFPKRIGQFLGLKESCSSRWIRTNSLELKQSLKDDLFGQQLAHELIPEVFEKLWKNRLNSKYLFLCFYGGPGTGKTFSTKLINKYIFSEGDRSDYYLFYSGAESHLTSSALMALKWSMSTSIADVIDECPYSIIVFDEADKYPKGFLDSVIVPFIENQHLDEQESNRGATFVFLTNIGSKQVMEQALQIDSSYFRSHHINYYDAIVADLKSTSQDGFFSSTLVQRGFVEHFVPYLPLREDSVMNCIQRSLSKYGMLAVSTQTYTLLVKDIMKEVDFVTSERYASAGCKRLDSLVPLTITKWSRRSLEKSTEL